MSDEKTEGKRPHLRLVKFQGDGDPILDKLRGKVSKANGEAVAANAFEIEDEYQDLYIGAARDIGILEPPYNLKSLDRLAQENNALSPCIEAMVTNVDGTGYDFEKEGEEAEDNEDDTRIEHLNDFFSQPWPGESFQTIRKKLRRDLERTGNAYLEVLRNAQDEIVFFRHVDAKMMRLVKLDDPIPVKKTVKRRGKDETIAVMTRERRFCQMVNGVSLVYFKEFGATRDVHKKSGRWSQTGQRLAAPERGTEIIHLTLLPDSHTPYGVPRWVSQLPSVLGSRKAEEFNLEFFDNGGVPPALIVLQGGTLQHETRDALEQKMTKGTPGKKNRIQILEVEPSGGSLEKESTVRVTVERFGAERQNDAMFENYDDKCETRIRRSFRLPPIFVGKADDYSFATAFASYTVAEAQVFKPERDEFDEVVTLKLVKGLGFEEYKIVSKPLVIEDATLKLEGINMAISTGQVEMDDVIYEINEAAGTDIRVSDKPRVLNGASHTIDADGRIVPVPMPEAPANSNRPGAGKPKAAAKKKPTPVEKTEHRGALDLALDTMLALRKRDVIQLTKNINLISSLDHVGFDRFRKASADLQFVDTTLDADGLTDLASCTISVMGRAMKQDCDCGHIH
ncbi:MAG: phage portal protein [Aquamicrobium sp.]|uniref:phage portal protein n=1 Tax=Aquamicrobium sp. TaxID=1872579 RepID=UPI00349EF8F4|nr:phage portal protein [Aquamicrobium sp.]